jgi:trehalose synthase
VRELIHLVILPLRDFNFNAILVNTVQRRPTIVVQKSLEEEFRLTVAEAMRTGRPVIASRVGGLTTQIAHEVTGLLVESTDFPGFGNAVSRLLHIAEYAGCLGRTGRRQCVESFLAERELVDYLRLYLAMLGA